MNIILGTAQLTNNYGLAQKNLSLIQLKKIIKLAKKKNFKFIDTAVSYRNVDKKLSQFDLSKFNIITKVSNLKKKDLQGAIKKHLKKLNVNRFHTIFLHDENELIGKQKNENYKILTNLKSLKLTKNVGVSVYSKKNTLKIMKNFKIDALQLPCNLFDKRFINKSFVKKAKRRNIKLYFRTIFLQGTLLNKNLYKREKRLKKMKIFNRYYNWIKNKNIMPLKVTFSFLKKMKIENAIIGVANFNEYNDIIKTNNYSYNFQIPNFKTSQKDTNYILRPDYWSINNEKK